LQSFNEIARNKKDGEKSIIMVHNNKEVLEYWNKPEVESMYDKYLINAEIDLICSKITEGSKILDAGCGEGEGALVYSQIKNTIVHAADFSETRLLKAKERLSHLSNIKLFQIDFLSDYKIDDDYDFIVSQRFLINLMEWELQKKVILDLTKHLKKGGKFYFSVPIGRQRIEFNAHRVFSIEYLLTMIKGRYQIDSFSYVNDAGNIIKNVEINENSIRTNFSCNYGCGIFELTKL